MFTGIVEEMGRLRERVDGDDGQARLVFEAALVSADATLGASIAVDGCCLTVVEHGPGWWAADAVAETLARTTLGALRPGQAVNLERPVRLADRLGGHLVQGHVDATAVVLAAAPALRVAVPEALRAHLVVKGSVALDGCSLTVVDVDDEGCSVAVIPHTARVTTLGLRRPGDLVNVEVDVVAKYVARLVSAGAPTPYAPRGRVAERRGD